MNLKGDQATTRALNRRLVINLLKNDGELSRAEIAVRSGLSPSAVTGVVAELLGDGFVVEGDAGKSKGGRKPIPVRINYECRFSIGLKLMPERLEAVLTNLATDPIRELSIPLSHSDPATAADAAATAVGALLPDADERAQRLIGVGLAMPGIVDPDKGICRVSQRLGWENVRIAEFLAERIHVPVWIENDVKTFAIAQQLFGWGRGCGSALVLIIGTGVGVGLIFNGRIHRGARFAAGEIGIPASGEAPLEERVTWNERFSEPAMQRDWRLLATSLDGRPPADLGDALAAGQPDALDFARTAGREIGRRLAQMIDLIDPEVVIIGGEAVRFGAPFVEPISAALRDFSFAAPPPLEVDWESNVWSRGAAALATQHFFDFENPTGLGREAKPFG